MAEAQTIQPTSQILKAMENYVSFLEHVKHWNEQGLETVPLVQIIDQPILPLPKTSTSKIKTANKL